MDYPIGIQTFEDIITGGFLYIDKTDYVYNLGSKKGYYFLSRPRRFGKSTLISTLEAYFLGKKELFKGLKIEGLEKEWETYPVLHLDLNGKDYSSKNALNEQLGKYLSIMEAKYGMDLSDNKPDDRFFLLIKKCYELTGKQVVILIDEYDKPLVETLNNNELREKFLNQLRAFYGVIKSSDSYVRFAMLTGVTKFSKVNVFSDLNFFKDISLRIDYQALCGITDDEIDTRCHQSVEALAKANDTDYDTMRQQLRVKYDGYRFGKGDTCVYNPFSLFNAFDSGELSDFWFDTGTPTFLTLLLKDSHIPIDTLTNGQLTPQQLSGNEDFESNPLPIMFQTGYLTIKQYDKRRDRYTLGFPNDEVRKAFVQALVPAFLRKKNKSPLSLNSLVDDLLDGHPTEFMQRLQTLYASLDYAIAGDMELYFHNTLCLIFWLIGLDTQTERHTSDGRMDATVETDNYVYIFEIKLDGSAEAALQQIDDKQYAAPFALSDKKIYKIGVNFSSTKRTLTDYRISPTD